MRFFRIPTFTGIEVHRDDADRGSLRVVEGCMPHGPGGLRSAPVWSDVGTISDISTDEKNFLTAANDGQGNSVMAVSKQGQIHDLAVVTTEGTSITNFQPSYQVINPLGLFEEGKAIIAPVGNKLYSFGDGDGEAVFIGKAQPDVTRDLFVAADNELYSHEWSRFPSCKFFIQGPKKTLFAAGNPKQPLRVYISEPASKTSPERDSPYSTEESAGQATDGQLSVVDILMSNATRITALSSRGDQIVVHTDKGCHILYAPSADQASTGYRVEQVAATNFSAAVNNQVVSGETGSLAFWLGFDGQIYKDESASRGADDAKSFADPDQASWKSKGLWEKNFPKNLSDSFACYDRESGMYWVYVLSESYLMSIKDGTPGLVTRFKVTAEKPGLVTNLEYVLDAPDVVTTLSVVPEKAGLVDAFEIQTPPRTEGIENLTALPDVPAVVTGLSVFMEEPGVVSNIVVIPDLPSLVSNVDAEQQGVGLVTDLEALPDVPAVVENLTSEIVAPDSVVSNLSVLPDVPGLVTVVRANEGPANVENLNVFPDLPGLVTQTSISTYDNVLIDLSYISFWNGRIDPYRLADGTNTPGNYHRLKVKRQPNPNFRGYVFYKYNSRSFIPRLNSPFGTPQIEMLKFWPPEAIGVPGDQYQLKPREVHNVLSLTDRPNNIFGKVVYPNQPRIQGHTFNVGYGLFSSTGPADHVFRYIHQEGPKYSAQEVKERVIRDRENCNYNPWYAGGFTNIGSHGSFLKKGCQYGDLSDGSGYRDIDHQTRVDLSRGVGEGSVGPNGLQYTEDQWALWGSIRSEVGHFFATTGSRGSSSYNPNTGIRSYPNNSLRFHELEKGITKPSEINASDMWWSQLEPGNGLPDSYSKVLSDGNIEDWVYIYSPEDEDLYRRQMGSSVNVCFAVAMLYELNGQIYETSVLNRDVSVKFTSRYTWSYESQPVNATVSTPPTVSIPPATVNAPDKPGVVTNLSAVKEEQSCEFIDTMHNWRYDVFTKSYTGADINNQLFITSLHSSGIGATSPFSVTWTSGHPYYQTGTPPFPNSQSNWSQYMVNGQLGRPFVGAPYGAWVDVYASRNLPRDGGLLLPIGRATGSGFPDNAWQMWVELEQDGRGNNGARKFTASVADPNTLRGYNFNIYPDANGRYHISLTWGSVTAGSWTRSNGGLTARLNTVNAGQTGTCRITGYYQSNRNGWEGMIVGMQPFGYSGDSSPVSGIPLNRGGAYHSDGTKFYLPYNIS